MDGETIKNFLVGLNFDIDSVSLAAFTKAIASASLKVTALYGSIQTAAAGIFYGMTKITASFEDMGYQLRLVAPAVNKMLILREAMLDAYRHAGIDLKKVVQESILFNYSLAKTKFALEAVYKSVASKFFPLLTKQMDIFRLKIFANMPKIQDSLKKFIDFIFKAFDATIQLGSRVWEILGHVWDVLKKLDDATGGWSTKILVAVAAWKLLNLGFLATPLGMIIAGITALIALYDDFKVWEKGGIALIDWGSKTTQMIVGITDVVVALGTAIGAIALGYKAWIGAQWLLNLAMTANPLGLIIAGVAALIGLLTVLAAKMGYLSGVSDFIRGLGEKTLGIFAGGGAAPSIANIAQPAPLVPANAANNQKVNQQTTINVNGAADAQAVGKAVAGEQSRVNFDMTRNLRGATR